MVKRVKNSENERFFATTSRRTSPALLSWHTLTDVSIKSVANQVESDIMNPICDRLIADGLHPFRIHDAIYLPENEVPQLNLNIKEEVFARINNDLFFDIYAKNFIASSICSLSKLSR